MNRWKILAFVFVLGMINFADKSVAGLSAVPIMKELHLSYEQWGIVGSSFFWLFSIAGAVGAALSDRIGTKKMLAILAIIWSIVQLGAFVITGFPFLILSRVMLGIGEGPFYATAVNHLSKWFKPDSQSFALSILNLGNTVGALISAPILVAIISKSGWRMAYGFLGILSMIWLIFWLWYGREKPIHTIEHRIVSEEKVKLTQIISVLKTPTFIVTALACFAAYWMTSFSIVWMPSFLVQAKHFTQSQMGYVIALMGVFGVIVNIIISRYVDLIYKKNQSYRKSHVKVGGLCLILAGLLSYSITLISSTGLTVAFLSLIQGFCLLIFGLCPQVINSLLPTKKGLMSGILVGFSTSAGMIVSIVTGKFVQSAGSNIGIGFNYSILLSSSLMLIFGVVFIVFARPDYKIEKVVQESKQFGA
ncbi:MFS transporter [Gottfriedia acidiceleris]|uniref:MFS transporter n=1 Tax=Gottfriedia acidiceleris TaxID=371036 RepID=UPI003D206DE5